MDLNTNNTLVENIHEEPGILDNYLQAHNHDPELIAEGLAIDFMEDVTRMLHEKGISRSELSDLMNVSRAYVTKLLNSPPNMTLMSVARLSVVLDAKPYIGLTKTQPLDLIMKIADTSHTWELNVRGFIKPATIDPLNAGNMGIIYENIPQRTPNIPIKVASTD
jgi:hypothetical protein